MFLGRHITANKDNQTGWEGGQSEQPEGKAVYHAEIVVACHNVSDVLMCSAQLPHTNT